LGYIFKGYFSCIFSVMESESLEIFIISKAGNVILTLFCGLRTKQQGTWIQQGSWVLVFWFYDLFPESLGTSCLSSNFFSLSTMKILTGWSLRFLPTVVFLISLFFNWRTVALQNCVGFCQISTWISHQNRSDQISGSVVSDSLRPHESQHARPPCPSPTPRVHSDSRPSS